MAAQAVSLSDYALTQHVVETTAEPPRYIQTLVVRNLSTYAKRIRCEVPKSAEFRVVTETLGASLGLRGLGFSGLGVGDLGFRISGYLALRSTGLGSPSRHHSGSCSSTISIPKAWCSSDMCNSTAQQCATHAYINLSKSVYLFTCLSLSLSLSFYLAIYLPAALCVLNTKHT